MTTLSRRYLRSLTQAPRELSPSSVRDDIAATCTNTFAIGLLACMVVTVE
jgi:hypothetical protein